MSSRSAVILIVEDDPFQRDLTVMALRRIGVMQPVHCVDGGIAAVAYVQGSGAYADRKQFPLPNLIITDLQMPDGDGYTLLRFLQAQPGEAICRIVVFSSVDHPDRIDEARRLGASTYIVKPTAFDEMCRALGAAFPASHPD